MTSPGTTGPSEVLQGSNTQLQGPTGIAVDSAGYIYTAGISPGTLNYVINMYAPLAAGTNNTAPVATISLGTNVFVPGLALDASGRIYLSNYNQKQRDVVSGAGRHDAEQHFAGDDCGRGDADELAERRRDRCEREDLRGERVRWRAGWLYQRVRRESVRLASMPHRWAQIFSATLGRASSVAVDTSGEIYVTDPDAPAVDEFAANPSGAVTEAPAGTIRGRFAGSNSPKALRPIEKARAGATYDAIFTTRAATSSRSCSLGMLVGAQRDRFRLAFASPGAGCAGMIRPTPRRRELQARVAALSEKASVTAAKMLPGSARRCGGRRPLGIHQADDGAGGRPASEDLRRDQIRRLVPGRHVLHRAPVGRHDGEEDGGRRTRRCLRTRCSRCTAGSERARSRARRDRVTRRRAARTSQGRALAAARMPWPLMSTIASDV